VNSDDRLIARISDRLKYQGGVAGVVLGGSRARATHNADSDYDVGVYYSGADALDLPALASAAQDLDDEHRGDLIAPPGAWGNWVNGGGWLVVDGKHVDIILRDVDRVGQAVEDCRAGRVSAHYQTGHPHAYINAMYAGELAIARVLAETDGRLGALKAKTLPYPEALREAILNTFVFEMGFSLMLAQANIGKEDCYYVAAHVVRAISCLNQVLFAVNREYCINEKKAVRMIAGFPLKPGNYAGRIHSVIATLGTNPTGACTELEAIITEARTLQ
jgi:Predicted nucleotidyltransferases